MIVVQTNEQKQDILYRIKNRWPDINLNSIRRNVVIAGDDIRMQIRGRLHPANRVAIDNLDQLLWMLFAAPVDFVTGTGTNVRPLPKEERYNG